VAQRPEYLTVPEVMNRLRLGRTTVYEQARLYLATGGAKGIPCRRFGRSLRFPAAAFEIAAADEQRPRIAESPQTHRIHDEAPATQRASRQPRRATSSTQSALPFAD
jgi:hypothetical protein